jgi:hypothetical protein
MDLAPAGDLHSSDGTRVIVSSFVQVLVWIVVSRPMRETSLGFGDDDNRSAGLEHAQNLSHVVDVGQ